MDLYQRNNVKVHGNGGHTLVFAHGFGCDQSMWRSLEPAFAAGHRTLRFDLVGNGGSDLSAWDPDKYSTLHGYATDLLEIVETCADAPVVFVGHSVSAIIGLLAANRAPERFAAQVMVSPSPCYINEGDYVGGFSRADIDGLLEALESNYLGWSSSMAPAIMGAPERPELGEELTNSFCRTGPTIAKHFARTTFLSDPRADLARSRTPALILQCTDDLIAPPAVGEYLHRMMPDSTLVLVENVGHCPHMSAAGASIDVIQAWLAARAF